MEQIIKEILQDLYQVDPNLKSQEKDLAKTIKLMLKAKPGVKITPQFKNKLKQELLAKTTATSPQTIKPRAKKSFFNFNYMTNLRKISYASLGLVVLVLALLIPKYWQHTNLPLNNQSTEQPSFSSKLNITKVANQAFGSLLSSAPANEQHTAEIASITAKDASSTNLAESALYGRGAGGSTTMAAAPKMINSMAETDSVAIDMPFVPTYYKFVYRGQEITLDQAELPVYRRLKNKEAGAYIAKELKQLDLGLMNIKSLGNLQAQNLTLVENKKDGYMINFDFREDTLNINRSYLYYEAMPAELNREVTKADMLDDESLIKIANQFLRNYQIDMSAYGTPEVDHSWEDYRVYEIDTKMYMPTIVSVIYPLSIDGQIVYDEGGAKSGPRVSIDLRNRQVESLWGVGANNFESSLYPAVQDSQKLISLAEKGGWRNYYYYAEESGGQAIEIELGQPTIEYVKIYNYNESNKENDELLVPCLVFPVTKVPEGQYYWQKNIIIPLIEELLKQVENQPMPMLKEGVAPSNSAGSNVGISVDMGTAPQRAQ